MGQLRTAHRVITVLMLFAITMLHFAGCASMKVTTAEEYFSLGMAYFDLGLAASDNATRTRYFLESEKWLNRARSVDKTKIASEYNLGRLAFETGRFLDAAGHFEGILKRDPNNILALKAAAYTRIRTGDIDKAEAHYQKLLTLIPESSDDGYNYALILYHMEKYERAEEILMKYQYALLDNNNSLLLFARTQNALKKVEAADTYARWLTNNKDAKVRCEYASVLEANEFYAKALEEYRQALEELAANSKDPVKSDVQFYIARLLLIADSTNEEGIKELEAAIKGGFKNTDELEKLVENEKLSPAHIETINTMIKDLKQEKTPAAKDDKTEAPGDEELPVEDLKGELEHDVKGSTQGSNE